MLLVIITSIYLAEIQTTIIYLTQFQVDQQMSKQTFHISHLRISQNVKGVLMSAYYFHVKTKI